MESHGLMLGFSVAFAFENLLLCAAGILAGMMVGVLPGIGSPTALALLLPATFYLSPAGAIIMLSGLFLGAQYGGTITSVLLKIPGEASTVVTTIDGYALAKKGRAGAALTVAATGSFIAGCVNVALIALFIEPLARVGLSFRPAEYCVLILVGLLLTTIAVTVNRGGLLSAGGMATFGVLLGSVGTDTGSGIARFTFGNPALSDGIGIVAIVMGMFGLNEIFLALEHKRTQARATIGGLWPTREEWRRSVPSIARGTAIGSLLGLIPGGGALLSSFASYALEKQVSRHRHEMGTGAIEGVAGPESANNAGAQASLVPLLAFGIPGNIVIALMVGALIMHGVAPGPGMWTKQPALFWGLIVSMWIANAGLLILSVPLVRVWVLLLEIPYRYLFPFVVLSMSFGAYCLSYSATDGAVVALFGLFGYLCTKISLEPVPLVLGLFLGPLLETNFQRALLLSRGDWLIFISSPLSAGMLLFGVAAIACTLVFRTRSSL